MMLRPFNKPDFERVPRDTEGTERERQERAARRLVEVLDLAEALPYRPKKTLDPPARLRHSS